MATPDLLKMSELAERSGVSSGTIKHYLREGLLGGDDEIVRTSRNMAYYPPEFVDRIRLIKRLQEERYMPLKLIRGVLERLAERDEAGSITREQAAQVHGVPENVLVRLEELGVLSSEDYGTEDARIVEAIARFRAGGFDETLGFTVYDTLRYRRALEPLVAEEVDTLLERLAGEVPVERALEIIASGSEPLRELIGAMHSKMLAERLRAARTS